MTETIKWTGSEIQILDQSLLPIEEQYIDIRTVDQLIDAICKLKIRGAPALGVAGAMGVALAARSLPQAITTEEFFQRVMSESQRIIQSRPTAVNLQWGVDRVLARMKSLRSPSVSALQDVALEESVSIKNEDVDSCVQISKSADALIRSGMSILTHCNTGSLATSGIGTALGIIKQAHQGGRRIHVYVDETRPLLQGSRLTAWELKKDAIPHTLICDNMAGYLMKLGKIDCAVVGADRIAANGDTANKIGTYGIAALCRFHSIPFYVAAPLSTIDCSLPDGESIPIEERGPEEITNMFGRPTSPSGTVVYNPAFDVTPGHLISAIITDKRIYYGPDFSFSN